MAKHEFTLREPYRQETYTLSFERSEHGKKRWILANQDHSVQIELIRENLFIGLKAKNIDIAEFEAQLAYQAKLLAYQAQIITQEATKLFGEEGVAAGRREIFAMAKQMVASNTQTIQNRVPALKLVKKPS